MVKVLKSKLFFLLLFVMPSFGDEQMVSRVNVSFYFMELAALSDLFSRILTHKQLFSWLLWPWTLWTTHNYLFTNLFFLYHTISYKLTKRVFRWINVLFVRQICVINSRSTFKNKLYFDDFCLKNVLQKRLGRELIKDLHSATDFSFFKQVFSRQNKSFHFSNPDDTVVGTEKYSI